MTTNPSTIKFYHEDIVRRVDGQNCGIVLRCWHDAEDDLPPASAVDSIMRPLERGEVGISFLPSMTHEIHYEKDFTLVDRSFQPGDLCKRAVGDVQSAVVTCVRVESRLEHAISGEPIEGWVAQDQVEDPFLADIGDYVIYDDWIGQVVESFEEATVELSTGQLVQLPEIGTHFTVGERGNYILPSHTGLMAYIMGHRPSDFDTVVAVKRTVLAVCWLAINQALDMCEAQDRQRPPRLWFGEELSKLTMVRGRTQHDMRIGDKVLLKDVSKVPVTQHGNAADSSGTLSVRMLTVKETRTFVDVLWQDGTRETSNSRDLIPYINPDEYDCWPGDHILWKGEAEPRTAVVQSVNAVDRTAKILYVDTHVTDIASVLELDPHGSTDFSPANSQSISEGLGVRRGELVLVHREGTTNGLEPPRVPKIGEIETWVKEPPAEMDGEYTGWRKEIADIGTQIATDRVASGIMGDEQRPMNSNVDSLEWFGEVTEIRLDGLVEVMHPNSKVAIYPLERLTRLHDTVGQLQEEWWADEGSDTHAGDEEAEETWSMDQDGVWQPQSHDATDADEWEETDESDGDMNIDGEEGEDWAEETLMMMSPPEPQHLPHDVPTIPSMVDPYPEPPQDHVEVDVITHDHTATPPLSADHSRELRIENDDKEDSLSPHWKRFDMLPSVPQDHAFISTAPGQPSKSFLARLTREYRVLETSLPDSIIVRAFEDRADLLRSLIIGPENTPYEDAPFVIDWMLESTFPHSPPKAHFLSWTNGNGRVNPNLYEDGKICLSILGTWAGDKNETWSAARSSLLQAFVSIQGLVLVKEPWFCEPAYEKLRGTEEGIVNSRLYNEKAYVLSRGFVRRALEQPVGGLEPEIRWMYYTNKRLEKVVRDANALIEKSNAISDNPLVDQDLAVPRLSGGGIITLDRTLSKLRVLLDCQRETSVG